MSERDYGVCSIMYTDVAAVSGHGLAWFRQLRERTRLLRSRFNRHRFHRPAFAHATSDADANAEECGSAIAEPFTWTGRIQVVNTSHMKS